MYAIATVAFGIISLLLANIFVGLEPVPATSSAFMAIAYATGAVFAFTGVAVLINERAHVALLILSAVYASWVLILHAPVLVKQPGNGGVWTTAMEAIALGAIASMAAAEIVRRNSPQRWREETINRLSNVSRVVFAFTLPVFGVLHFVYAQFVSNIVPAWFPARLFLTNAVGVAFVLAGISIGTLILSRLAGILLAVMFASWVLVLHIPLTIANNDQNHWTSLFIAVAMCGGSLMMASVGRRAVRS